MQRDAQRLEAGTLRRVRRLLFSTLFLLGCDSVSDVVAKHRAGVEKTFATLKSLGPLVDAVPAVTEVKV